MQLYLFWSKATTSDAFRYMTYIAVLAFFLALLRLGTRRKTIQKARFVTSVTFQATTRSIKANSM